MDKTKTGQDSKKSEWGNMIYDDCQDSPTSTGRESMREKSGYVTNSQDNDKSSGYQSNKKQSARTRVKKQEMLSVLHSESDQLSKELIEFKPELQLLRRKHAHLLVLKKRMLDELHDIQVDSDASMSRIDMNRLPKLQLDVPNNFLGQQMSPHSTADIAALMQSGGANLPMMGSFGNDFQQPVSPMFANQQNPSFFQSGMQSSQMNGNSFMNGCAQQQFSQGAPPGVDISAIIHEQLQMRQNM